MHLDVDSSRHSFKSSMIEDSRYSVVNLPNLDRYPTIGSRVTHDIFPYFLTFLENSE